MLGAAVEVKSTPLSEGDCASAHMHVRALSNTTYCSCVIVQMEETSPAVSPNARTCYL